MGMDNAVIIEDIIPNWMQLKNSTSLTANWKLLLNLYISTFLVLKLISMLIFLRPVSSTPDGTSAISTYG